MRDGGNPPNVGALAMDPPESLSWLSGVTRAIARGSLSLILSTLAHLKSPGYRLRRDWGRNCCFAVSSCEAFSESIDPQTFGRWLPLVLSSLLFGLAHAVSWTYLGLATGVGLYLGILLTVSGSLWVPVDHARGLRFRRRSAASNTTTGK